MQAAKYYKTPSSPVNHRRSTDEFLTITKHVVTPILTSENMGTWEMFSQVALDIKLFHAPEHYNTLLIRHHSLISSLSGPELNKGEQNGVLRLCIMSHKHSWRVVASIDQKKFSLAPDIQHMTPPGCRLCIGNHGCLQC